MAHARAVQQPRQHTMHALQINQHGGHLVAHQHHLGRVPQLDALSKLAKQANGLQGRHVHRRCQESQVRASGGLSLSRQRHGWPPWQDGAMPTNSLASDAFDGQFSIV